ncbi:hypothetical protein FQZ97_278800 [compost metagenome]
MAADGDAAVAADGDGLVLADVFLAVPADGDGFVVADVLLAVVADGDGFIVLHALAAVMPDEGGLVVVDVVVLVLLGVDEDLFLPGLVLEAQLIEALALVGLALDGHPRLVGRQLVGRQLQGVVGSARNHGLVRVPVEVADDDLLADARDGHVAPEGTRPVLRYAYPAGTVFVVLALAVPRELHLHPPVFVAVDFLARRADHGGLLGAVDARLGQRRGAPLGIVRHQGGGAAVVRSLLGVGAFLGLAGVLLAMVLDAHRAPATVHVFARVADEVEGDARHQARVVTLDGGRAHIAAVAAQAVPGEALAHRALVAPGIVVMLVAARLVVQVVTLALGLLVVPRVLEVVVALGLARGAHVLAVGEAAQRRARAVAAGHGVVFHRRAGELAENPQAVAVDEAVAFGAVLEAVEEAFLAHDAFDEVVVGVAGLHAVLARRMGVGDFLLVVEGDAVLLQHRLGDVGHGEGLEDAPVRGESQAGQARLHDGAVAGAAKAGVALLEGGHRAVQVAHWLAALPDGEQPGAIEHLAEVDGGVGAAQVHVQPEGLGQAFVEPELDHVEVVGAGGEGEAQIGLDCHGKSSPARSRASAPSARGSDRRA